MPAPVKISDRLLTLAKEEAAGAHRSTTAQIEHWATLGRAVEVMLAYRDVLALKRTGLTLPIPAHVSSDDVREVIAAIAADTDRERVRERIHAGGLPVYTTDPKHPGMIVEVQADGTRTPGYMDGRTFVPAVSRDLDRRAARVRRSRPPRARRQASRS
jgi:hypothetical protein